MLSKVLLHGCVLAEILQNATFYLVPQVLYTNIDTKQKLKIKELKKNKTIKKRAKKTSPTSVNNITRNKRDSTATIIRSKTKIQTESKQVV